MSKSKNKKRSFDAVEQEDEVMAAPLFTMKSRQNDFNERTWWMVDLDCSIGSNQGATALVKRCMRNYDWNLDKTKGILKAYRQFLTLKKEQEDWDATILSPSHLVDQMWHQHILDIGNYYHDMILLCGGQIVLHNPDGALDQEAKKSRDEKTRSELIKKFGSENVDREVWGFPPKSVMKTDSSDDESSSDDEELILKDAGNLDIIIKDPSNHEVYVRVLWNTRMDAVMATYANRRGVNKADYRFFYHGKRIEQYHTPGMLKMTQRICIIEVIPFKPIVTISFIDLDGHKAEYKKIKRHAKLYPMCVEYAIEYEKRTGTKRREYSFIASCGEPIGQSDSPASLDFENDDYIQLFRIQGGC